MNKVENIYQQYFANENDPYTLTLLCSLAFTRVASHREDSQEKSIPEWAPIEAQLQHLAQTDPDRAVATATQLLSLPDTPTYFGWLHANAVDLLKIPPTLERFAAQVESTSLVNSPLAQKLFQFLSFDVTSLDPKTATDRPELYKLASAADLAANHLVDSPAWTGAQTLFDLAYDRMSDPQVQKYISLYNGTAVQGLYDSLAKIFWKNTNK